MLLLTRLHRGVPWTRRAICEGFGPCRWGRLSGLTLLITQWGMGWGGKWERERGREGKSLKQWLLRGQTEKEKMLIHHYCHGLSQMITICLHPIFRQWDTIAIWPDGIAAHHCNMLPFPLMSLFNIHYFGCFNVITISSVQHIQKLSAKATYSYRMRITLKLHHKWLYLQLSWISDPERHKEQDLLQTNRFSGADRLGPLKSRWPVRVGPSNGKEEVKVVTEKDEDKWYWEMMYRSGIIDI